MSINLTPVDPHGEDLHALASFTARNGVPFAPGDHATLPDTRALITAGAFDAPDNALWWLDDDVHARVGLLAVAGVTGEEPSLWLHVEHRHRGRGIGTEALRLVIERVFTDHPQAKRLQGRASEDHRQIRQALARCGFVKEAHFRDTWPVAAGEPGRATVVYAILRRDWESGVTTPVRFDDLGY